MECTHPCIWKLGVRNVHFANLNNSCTNKYTMVQNEKWGCVETCIDISFISQNNVSVKKWNQSFLGFGNYFSFALGIGKKGFGHIHVAKKTTIYKSLIYYTQGTIKGICNKEGSWMILSMVAKITSLINLGGDFFPSLIRVQSLFLFSKYEWP